MKILDQLQQNTDEHIYLNLSTAASVALTPNLFAFTKPANVLDNNSNRNIFLFMR